MRLSPLILLFILPFSLAEEETPISSKISGYFIVFFLLLCAVLLKYILRNCRSRGSTRDSNLNVVNVEVGDLQGLSVGAPQQSSGGVDRNLINSLPVFEFAALTESSVGSECAICLGRFEGKDSLHLLPKCRHAFHRECIDKWLEDHSSCPICRQSVDAQDISAFVSSNSRDCTNLKVDGADRKRVHGFEHRITVLDANFDSTSR